MKKTPLFFTILCVLFMSGCEKEKAPLINLKNKKIPLDSFFETILNQKIDTDNEDNALYIDYVFNKKDKSIEIVRITEKELGFFPICKNSGVHNQSDDVEKKYKVTCMKDGKDVWTKECSNQYSCGSLVYDCLETGGCSTICTQTMLYMPKSNAFYLIDLEVKK